MSFGQVIKKLRRNADMTQEQLAELLSISPQAVSRWETDAAMPDISLLRPIANIFGVTSDVLLEIDISRVKEAVEDYKQQIATLYRAHEYAKMLEVARLACREIPANHELIGQLAFALTSGDNAANAEHLDEAILLYKLILEKSVDNMLRHRASAALCRLYAQKKGDREQALLYANQLPKGVHQTSSALIMQYGLLDDASKNETYRLWIEQYARALTDTMYLLADPNYQNSQNDLSAAQRIEILEKLLTVLQVVYGDKLLSVNREFYEIHRVIAGLYLLDADCENALAHLDKAAEHAVAFDAYSDDESYTSPVMYGIATDGHDLWDNTAADDMLERLHAQARYDVLRKDARFQQFVEKLSDK